MLALPFLLVFVIYILLSEEHPLQRDENHEEETPAEYGNRHRRRGRSYSRPVEEAQQSPFIALLVMPRVVVQQPAHDLPYCRRCESSSSSTRQATPVPSQAIYMYLVRQASDRGRDGELVIAAGQQPTQRVNTRGDDILTKAVPPKN